MRQYTKTKLSQKEEIAIAVAQRGRGFRAT
jgi:hypothetical protein